jgi:hypothetical protein
LCEVHFFPGLGIPDFQVLVSSHNPRGGEDTYHVQMAASRRKRLLVNATLIKRVQASVNALEITPADEGLVGLALLLASTIDGMDDDTKQKMLGQTAGQLVGVLAALRKQAAPKRWSKWDEMRPGPVASRRIGAGRY